MDTGLAHAAARRARSSSRSRAYRGVMKPGVRHQQFAVAILPTPTACLSHSNDNPDGSSARKIISMMSGASSVRLRCRLTYDGSRWTARARSDNPRKRPLSSNAFQRYARANAMTNGCCVFAFFAGELSAIIPSGRIISFRPQRFGNRYVFTFDHYGAPCSEVVHATHPREKAVGVDRKFRPHVN